VDGDRLYALAADGMLVCLETATGKTIWGYNIVDHFHGQCPALGDQRIAAGGWRPRDRDTGRTPAPPSWLSTR
jgi:outer membrane protein assembly factor BamB